MASVTVYVSETDRKHLVVHGQHFPSYQLHCSLLWQELASNHVTSAYQQYTTTTLMTPNFCVIPVTCTIMQKNGAGLHTASSCFWDNSTDGSCTVRWENKTMYCIVSVFGLAI
jgi:Tctex-1 family.